MSALQVESERISPGLTSRRQRGMRDHDCSVMRPCHFAVSDTQPSPVEVLKEGQKQFDDASSGEERFRR